MIDKMNIKINEKESLAAKSTDKEDKFIPNPTGEIFDYFIYPDGKKVLIHHGKNLVVNVARNLMAALMKSEAGFGGITYWAIGSGSSEWSDESPPAPELTDTALLSETYRKAVVPASDIVFLDESEEETLDVTNKIKITVTFSESEGNGSLREFGLFGGDASAVSGSGIMINRKTHGLIYKTSSLQLQRVLILTFPYGE